MFRLSKQHGIDPTKPRILDIERKDKELTRWKNKTMVFINDMTDTFGEFYSFDLIEQWHQLFERHPDKQFQLLTKRIGRAMLFYRERPVPKNVWLGCSIGERSRLFRIEQLKKIDAKIRFVSFEPVIEDLGDFSLEGIEWAIVGGESDYYHPRPMKPEWAESIRQICERDKVAFFFKQLGGKHKCECCNAWGCAKLNGQIYREYPKFEIQKLAYK